MPSLFPKGCMYLTVWHNQELQQIVKLEGTASQWLIGRDVDCAVVLADNQVSRRHARIYRQLGEFYLEDCGSKLGVRQNGELISAPVLLSERDSLGVGDYELKLSATPMVLQSVQNWAAEETIEEFKYASLLYTGAMMDLKQRIHESVLRELNLGEISAKDFARRDFRHNINIAVQKVMRDFWHELPKKVPADVFRDTVLDDLVNLGPLSGLLRADDIDEIMVNGPDLVYVEKKGVIYKTGVRFFNERHLLSIIQRIVEPIGRHIDEVSPMVDARLPDGSRVNAVIPPLAIDGASITIRKFGKKYLTTDDLISYDSLSREMALFLHETVRLRQSIVVTGGTGTGKTTLLNVLSHFIPLNERLVTIEDSAELRLNHENLVRLESRMANIEGKGKVSIRELVINSLRMRPDRIIVGECRGGEAWDMLQAMNTGHAGSLTTIHANSPQDGLARLENMVLMSGFELPVNAIREQIASAINFVVHLARLADGSRKIVQISEITGREGNTITMRDIFVYRQTGLGSDGKVEGEFLASGSVPAFIDTMRERGMLQLDMAVFTQQGS